MGIIPPENDRLMLVLLNFALPDKPMLLRPDALQQNSSRFIGRVLWNQLALDGLLEAIGIDREKICTYCWTGKE